MPNVEVLRFWHLPFGIWHSSLNSKLLRIPDESQLTRRRHVADQCRGRDDRGAREVAFAAEPHPVLPVPVERGDGTLAGGQRVLSLAEARPAPRLPDLPSDRAEDRRDRLAVQAGIRQL